jgi:hypothetical protein
MQIKVAVAQCGNSFGKWSGLEQHRADTLLV